MGQSDVSTETSIVIISSILDRGFDLEDKMEEHMQIVEDCFKNAVQGPTTADQVNEHPDALQLVWTNARFVPLR